VSQYLFVSQNLDLFSLPTLERHCICCHQVNLVGKAQTSYLPGVLVPEVNAGGAAALAGFKSGDIILRVGDFEVPASNKQVCTEQQRQQQRRQWQCQLAAVREAGMHLLGSSSGRSDRQSSSTASGCGQP
jgi:hypothetical protein